MTASVLGTGIDLIRRNMQKCQTSWLKVVIEEIREVTVEP